MNSAVTPRNLRRPFGRAVARQLPARSDTALFWSFYAGWLAFFLILLG